MWMNRDLAILSVAAMSVLGCGPAPSAAAAAVNDKVVSVTPDSAKMRGGIVTGLITETKGAERVEVGSGRIAPPAKISGRLDLENKSADQTPVL